MICLLIAFFVANMVSWCIFSRRWNAFVDEMNEQGIDRRWKRWKITDGFSYTLWMKGYGGDGRFRYRIVPEFLITVPAMIVAGIGSFAICTHLSNLGAAP